MSKKRTVTRRDHASSRTTSNSRRRQASPEELLQLRARLLDAARECFVRRGVASTSLREVALEAGVRPELMRRIFRHRQNLFDAFIDERLVPLLSPLRDSLLRAGTDVSALVAAFVVGMGMLVAQQPWFPRFWCREALLEEGALRESLFTKIGPLVPQLMVQRLAAAKSAGHLNGDLDPRLFVVSMLGFTLFTAAVEPIWRRMFSASDIDADAILRHTIALLDHGISAPSSGTYE